MPTRFPSFIFSLLLITILTIGISSKSFAEVNSVGMIDIHAANHGEIAQNGFFTAGQRIDLVFVFDLDASSSDIATLTWDVYNRYDRIAHSGSLTMPCEPGMNTLSVGDAIPTDLGAGTQTYYVYGSVTVDGKKVDTEFEIRIENPNAHPGLNIEDVRLIPRDDNSPIASEMEGVAIPYRLEIDFRTENIISWAHAQIRWLGMTADGFELDRGLGSTDVDEGFNRFTVDSYIARPPYGSMPAADFSVEVVVFGYFDSVTFPLESLPVSLMEIRSQAGVANENDFSIGEAYLYGVDGARTNYFQSNEMITARLLTGGSVPENTTLLMQLSRNTIVGGGLNDDDPDTPEQFVMDLEGGLEMPVIEYELPGIVTRDPGYYDFVWTLVVGESVFAERRANITISGREGIVIPMEIELPGGIIFTAPILWDVTRENEGGVFATMVTSDNITCRLLAQTTDTPLNVELIADLFEDKFMLSGLPPDATLLTTDSGSMEGTWEYLQRAWLGGGQVFVNDFWLVRAGEGEYIVLTATSTGDENSVSEAYSASEHIQANLDLGV